MNGFYMKINTGANWVKVSTLTFLKMLFLVALKKALYEKRYLFHIKSSFCSEDI